MSRTEWSLHLATGLNGRLSCEQIEQLWCELIIPEQNKEQKESEE